MDNWKIHKNENASGFWLIVGNIGVPGSVIVNDLTRIQGQELGTALLEIERLAKYDALAAVRDAMGVK